MKLYGEIAKAEEQDDGTIIVSGYASSEDVDSDGEVITAEAMKAALPDYMRFANIREMHTNSAAGIALKAEVQEDGRTYIEAHIVDESAVKKVKKKVYKGFSIGGRVLNRDDLDKNTITSIRLSEISLVDRPANPKALFAMWKGDGVDPNATPEAEAAADVTPPVETPAAEAPADDAQKGMMGVARLACLIKELMYLQQDQDFEAALEEDGSVIPAQLKDNIAALVGTLQSMVAEESSEVIENLGTQSAPAADVDVVAMAAATSDLTKAGSRHNKADMALIQAIHDHTVALGAVQSNVPAEDTDDLSSDSKKIDGLVKLAAEKDEALEKALKENGDILAKNESLEKRVKELEALPQPAKGVLKVVDKSQDDALAATKAAEVEPAKDDVLGQILKVHRQGPTIKLN